MLARSVKGEAVLLRLLPQNKGALLDALVLVFADTSEGARKVHTKWDMVRQRLRKQVY